MDIGAFRKGLVLAMVMAAAAPASADVKAGVDAWTRGDFAAAIAEWQGPAERGDADAQFNLGQAYKLGRGVKQDLARAEELFAKAAVQNHMQASDNYGLMLFQRGERAKAMPYIGSAADRGDPRSQYLLGLAHFNGDNVPKDWVRAYALVSLAQQAGLPQAGGALSQMDQYIPIEQRQQSAAMAQELATQAEATRARQLAAADLAASVPNVAAAPTAPVVTATPRPPVAAAPAPPAVAEGPRGAGADFVRPPPQRPVAVANPKPPAVAAAPRPAPASKPQPAAAPPPPVRTASASGGENWRVQLGAFGVASNAEAMWNRVRSRPELAGHAKLLVPKGGVTKLQAGGYASEDAARSACARLSAAGISCLAIRN